MYELLLVIYMSEIKNTQTQEQKIRVTLDTVAQKPLVQFDAPKDSTIEEIVSMGAEHATGHRIKGGAAFKRMVDEGYQVKNAATNAVVKTTTQIKNHVVENNVHYLVNAAGENGYIASEGFYSA